MEVSLFTGKRPGQREGESKNALQKMRKLWQRSSPGVGQGTKHKMNSVWPGTYGGANTQRRKLLLKRNNSDGHEDK